MAQCLDCRLFYLPRMRNVRCPGCTLKRIAAQKQASQDRRRPSKRRQEQDLCVDEAAVDRAFETALKEIRRQRADSLEPFRSYRWLYS